MWTALQKVSSLMYVSTPIIGFVPQKGCLLPEIWTIGTIYKLKLYLFGIIPFGDHFIRLVEIDHNEKTIISNEHGKFIKVWNHTIRLKPIDDHAIDYTDEVEIEAGILTLPVWLFAHLFYRHRQKKWKKLLSR